MNWNVGMLPLVVVCLGGLGLLLLLLTKTIGRDRQRQKRLEVLGEALRSGGMDSELRREVVEVLKSEQSRGFSWRHLWFSLGWFGLFAGGGLATLGPNPDDLEKGLITIVASLAIVTLPLAIRELEARRAPDRGAS